MALSNFEVKTNTPKEDTVRYNIDPDLLDIIKGFFEGKGFEKSTANILANNMITNAIEAGDVTREDLLDTIKRGGDILAVKTFRIQKPGTGYAINDKLTFKYRGMLEEAQIVVTNVNSTGGILDLSIESPGSIETKPNNPLSPSTNTGAGRGAFFILSYETTLKPNAELSALASYLINVSRFPSSFTGIASVPELNKVYNRLVV